MSTGDTDMTDTDCTECGYWPVVTQCHACGSTYRQVREGPTGTNSTNVDVPLASPGIATASRSPNTPPDHPAGINHPDDQWTTTIAELAKFAEAGGDLGEWESLDADGLHELWWPIHTDELDNLDGRFPLRVRRRQP